MANRTPRVKAPYTLRPLLVAAAPDTLPGTVTITGRIDRGGTSDDGRAVVCSFTIDDAQHFARTLNTAIAAALRVVGDIRRNEP